MFSDSLRWLKTFSCGQTKCGYLICFGIAPSFKEQFEKILHETPYFVALFDETYNAVSKNGHMDLHVKFWGSSENLVKTRYWNSEFLGKAAAKDLYEKFNQGLFVLKKQKKIQISSDGQDVNYAFLDIVNKNRNPATNSYRNLRSSFFA